MRFPWLYAYKAFPGPCRRPPVLFADLPIGQKPFGAEGQLAYAAESGCASNARLVAVLRLLDLVDLAPVVAHSVVGEVLGQRRFACNQFMLTGIGTVTVDAPFVAVQKIGQLVVHVGRCHHRAVPQTTLAVEVGFQRNAASL
jgi:hypothetical protein